MFYIASIMIVNMHKLACVKNHHVFFFFFAKNIEWLQILQNRQLQMGKAQKKKKKGQIFWNKKLCCSQDLIKDLHLLN